MILEFGDISISLSGGASEKALRQILKEMLYVEIGYDLEMGLKEGKDIETLRMFARQSAIKLWISLLPTMLDEIADELVNDCEQDDSVPF